MVKQRLGYNDVVLFGSLIYAGIDLSLEWEAFEVCSRPVHKWLIVSYAVVASFRAIHWLGYRAISGEDIAGPETDANGAVASELLLNLRHKDFVPRAVTIMTWVLGVPFFSLWTVLGTWWLWRVLVDTPECWPSSIHLYFCLFWLLLCYGWIAVHAAIGVAAVMLERMVRRAEGRLQEIEDADVRDRWGAVGRLGSFQDLVGGSLTSGEGLSSAEIQALPTTTALATDDWLMLKQKDCSICLGDFEPGDACRSLPACSHTFHKACVDLWLVRRAECPLCKACVIAPSA